MAGPARGVLVEAVHGIAAVHGIGGVGAVGVVRARARHDLRGGIVGEAEALVAGGARQVVGEAGKAADWITTDS